MGVFCLGAGLRLQDERPGAGGVHKRLPQRRRHRRGHSYLLLQENEVRNLLIQIFFSNAEVVTW